jgi:predicted TIM-barrel fold metal-dependent hydrolase
MKVVSIEEHFLTPEIIAAWDASTIGSEGTAVFEQGEVGERIKDLGEGRLALMDESGIDVQVLSITTPALHNLEVEESVSLAQETNHVLAAIIARHPTRFQGFAVLPMAAPQEAARELERCIKQLGFCGSMLCGRTRDKNLDHPDSLSLLETAAELRVPLFIHPQIPQASVREALYSGFNERVDMSFATFGLGWHYEAGIQFVRLILSGTFDRFPNLQVILGHWGRSSSSIWNGADRLRV